MVSSSTGQRGQPPRTAVTRWLLRMLLLGGALDELADAGCWPRSDLIRALRLGDDARKRSVKSMRRRLQRWLDDLEVNPPSLEQPLADNVVWLAAKLGLGPVERDLLSFATLMQVEDALGACLGRGYGVPRLGVPRACKRIAVAIDASETEVRTALRPGSMLYGSRLVRYKEAESWLEPVLQTVDELTPLLFLEHDGVDTLLAAFFRASDAAAHGLDVFPHLSPDLEVLLPWLRAGLASRTPGMNVLLHGPAGTGKTELARAVARELGASLYEVNIADEDGEPTSALGRLAAYALCQRVLEGAGSSMVLFDEIEDVLPRGTAWAEPQSVTGSCKGWLTRTLERNPVPAVWISNAVAHIDPAILRRFDLVIPVRVPPARVRAEVLERHTSGLGVRTAWIQRVAKDERIRPGHVERACRVARALAMSDAATVELALDRVLQRAIAAEGIRSTRRSATSDPCPYRLDLLNASVDTTALIEGFSRRRRGTAILHGPPGTGKSAFAAHCADQIGVPLIVRKASDLVSCWIGQTEQNFAEMFASAEDEGALLLLDEADGFLQDRRRAQRTWEITEVNELLVQMEQYSGIFFCATNLLETLDPAALRRFDAKVRFDPLRPEQRRQMLQSMLASLAPGPLADARLASTSPDELSGDLRQALDRLHELTPGDFAAVARRVRLLGLEVSAASFIRELEVESVHKPGGGKRLIGLARGGAVRPADDARRGAPDREWNRGR